MSSRKRAIMISPANAAWLSLLLSSVTACGADDRPPPAADDGAGGSMTTDAAGPATGGRDAREDGGLDSGSDAETDASGGPFPAVCGDGVLGIGEACDGDQFSQGACVDFGFDLGMVSCTEACTVDTSACSGTEDCTDGRDNDGNGLVDCDDPVCVSECGHSCDLVDVLIVGESISGTTRSQPNVEESSCAVDGSGPEKVYEVTIPSSGTFEVTLTTSAFLGVSLRTECEVSSTELACGLHSVSAPVAMGDVLYVFVEGLERGVATDFLLTTRVEQD